MAALVGRLVELGYGVGWRVLDARHFGVPQRRRRVFIVALRPGGRAGAERAAEVLSVGSRCSRHPATGGAAGEGAPGGADGRIAHALGANDWKGPGHNRDGNIVGPPPDAAGVRAPDGLAGRMDGGERVAYNPYRTLERDGSVTSGYAARDVVDALHSPTGNKEPLVLGNGTQDDLFLPLGLDSHRYRCCGNGVVAHVAEWIGWRLREALA